MNTYEIGREGEDRAIEWFNRKDYEIVFRNFRDHRFEIDIVAICKEGVLRFIEVKNIQNGRVEDAVSSIEKRNISRYIHGIDNFITLFPEYRDNPISMDVLILDRNDIYYYKNITSDLVV